MTPPQTRTRRPRTQTTIRLPSDLNDALTRQAEAVGCSRSMLLASILEWWAEENATVEWPLTRREGGS